MLLSPFIGSSRLSKALGMFQSFEMQWAFKIYNNIQVFKSSEILETFIVLSEFLRQLSRYSRSQGCEIFEQCWSDLEFLIITLKMYISCGKNLTRSKNCLFHHKKKVSTILHSRIKMYHTLILEKKVSIIFPSRILYSNGKKETLECLYCILNQRQGWHKILR